MHILINNAISLCNDIQVDTLKINSFKTQLQKFYYEILFINLQNFVGAMFLLDKYREKPFFQIPVVSIIRDVIANIILAEYISFKETDPKANLEDELERIYADHYLFTENQRKMEKLLFGSYANYRSKRKEFEYLGNKYRDENGSYKSSIRASSSLKSRVSYIFQKAKGRDKENIKMLYLWYNSFSKISHYGELSINTIVNNYASKNEEKVFKEFYFLIVFVLTSLVGLLEKISAPDKISASIEFQLRKIADYELNP